MELVNVVLISEEPSGVISALKLSRLLLVSA